MLCHVEVYSTFRLLTHVALVFTLMVKYEISFFRLPFFVCSISSGNASRKAEC